MNKYASTYIDSFNKVAMRWSNDISRDLMNGRKYGPGSLISETGELVDEIKDWNVPGMKDELGDVLYNAQMLPYQYLPFNMPVFGADATVDKYMGRRQAWQEMFKREGLEFSTDYLSGGSNFAKPEKIQQAFRLAGKDLPIERAVLYSKEFSPEAHKQIMSQQDIFNKLQPVLPPGAEHGSGAFPDVRDLSDVDISLYSEDPQSIEAQMPHGTVAEHGDGYSMYAIPGYDRPVNLMAGKDKKRVMRAPIHRAIQLELQEKYPSLAAKALALKKDGMKTESAWASVLGANGDHYETMANRDLVMQLANAAAAKESV